MTINHKRLRVLTGVAIFTAIVIALQLAGSFIRFGTFSISLVLIPIVLGGALYGPLAGMWLGLVFGAAVLLSGDANTFMVLNVGGTIATVLIKGVLAGLAAGLVYKALEHRNQYAAVICAAIICPVVNTGVFLIGCLVFFMDTIRAWGEGLGFTSVGKYMIVGLVGLNFIFELVLNVVLSPVVLRLINEGRKTLVGR
ncbi:MAG: ECF transporter S component [Firmicutes bacterium]|nr:ECF transporter S component [Bacillota bacterium]